MNNYKLVKNTELEYIEVNGEDKLIASIWIKDNNLNYFNQFSSVKGGKSFKASDFLKVGEYKVIKIKNVGFGRVRYNDIEYISKEIAKHSQQFLLIENDILISMTGSGPSAPNSLVGRVAIASSNDVNCFVNQRVGMFHFNENVNKKFMFYYLSLKETQNFLVTNSTGSANQVNISTETIGKLNIPFVSLKEQSSIASILSAQEAIISDIESLISKYESRFQYLSEELLSGRLRVKEVDGQTIFYKNAEDNWKEVEVNGEMKEIPVDWEVQKIKDIARFKNGYAFPKEEISEIKTNNKLLKIGNVALNKKYLTTSNNQIYLNNINANFELFNEDLIIAMDDLTPTVTFIGTTTIIKNETGRLFQNQRLGSLYPKKIDKKYLNLQINHNQYIFGKIATGSTAKNLSKPMIEDFEIKFGNNEDQVLISRVLSDAEELISQQSKIVIKEKQKFDWLLDNLLSGKYLVQGQ